MRTFYSLGVRTLIFAGILLSACQLFAQGIPNGVEPGSQAERYLKESEKRRKELERKKTPASKVEFKPQASPLLEAQAVSFMLKEVKITGSTYFTPGELTPLYNSYLYTAVTLKELEAIAQNIKARYAKEGFLSAVAYVPKQEIAQGKVEIRVVEGKVGKISVEGKTYCNPGLIEKYIPLKKNELLNFKSLQSGLLLLNRNSGLEVRSVIESGEEFAASDIVLQAKERFPYHAGVGFDNQGSRLTGKYRGQSFVRSSNLSGRLDSLMVSALFTSLSVGQTLSYTLPVGTRGNSWGVDVLHYKMLIGKEYKPDFITGRSLIYVPRFSWKVYLTEDTQVFANAGLQIKSMLKRVAGERDSDDQMRLPYLSFSIVRNDPLGGRGQTSFSPTFTYGLTDLLGASSKGHPSSSRDGARENFFKYEQSLTRFQWMPFDSNLRVHTQFQAADCLLPSSEQFQLGGANSIRGYPEGDYSADLGGYANLEWALPAYLIPKSFKLPGYTLPLRYQLETVFFADIGGGKSHATNTQQPGNKLLAGIGGGLRFNLQYLSLRLDWAVPVADKPSSGNGPSTFYLTFQSEY